MAVVAKEGRGTSRTLAVSAHVALDVADGTNALSRAAARVRAGCLSWAYAITFGLELSIGAPKAVAVGALCVENRCTVDFVHGH